VNFVVSVRHVQLHADLEDAQRGQTAAEDEGVTPASPPVKRAPTGIKRLTYTERREWEQMESAIQAAEQARDACQAAAGDPSIAANTVVVQQRYAELQAAQENVDRLYARWAELEEKQTTDTR
jgi:ATP-binding cassette subfamily F protein uup